MKLTLNGHLLPWFRLVGNHIVLPAAMRGQIRPIWGASEITYISADGKNSYTVRHNKRNALRESRGVLRSTLKMWRYYGKVRDDWRHGYGELTQRQFWTGILNTPESTEPPQEETYKQVQTSA